MAQPSTDRICPACGSKMQLFRVRGVEIDRCQWCGGVHFDAGEVEAASATPVVFTVSDVLSAERCASCGVEMREAEMKGLRAASCPRCQGVFLDGEAVRRLLGDAHPAPLEQEEVTFCCSVCGTELGVGEGMASGAGLTCARCYGQSDAGSPGAWSGPAVATHGALPALSAGADLGGAAETHDLLLAEVFVEILGAILSFLLDV